MKCKVCSKLADIPPGRSASGSQWQFKIFTFELILADQLADLHPLGRSASGSEWQFQIFTVRAHMGRSTDRFTPPWVDLPVHLYRNVTFLLSELILADLSDTRSAISQILTLRA